MNTAFVSYCRSDLPIALDLLKKLEKYPYPQDMVTETNRPCHEKFVRPIFLDVLNLPVKDTEFRKDIQEGLRNSKYLIVICSPEASESAFVREEVDFFLEAHNNNADLIIAVYVDKVFHGMHPVIDKIVASRNCPIYVTSEGEAGRVGRKYCFYHLLEFLLKVDFDKLYNRYEKYKKRKTRHRIIALTIALCVIIGALIWAWISQIQRADSEREKAMVSAQKAEFEQKTFPFSIVVGYVGNFLRPIAEALSEFDGDAPILVYMPYSYKELDSRFRIKKYGDYLRAHYAIDSTCVSRHNIQVPSRRRDMTIVRIDFDSIHVYVDNATTVSAFKAVIDYKLGKDVDWGQDKDSMVRFYTNEFVNCSLDSLGSNASRVHFIRNISDLDRILLSIGIPRL